MSKSLENNRLEKVFFAIRTDFFGFPNEHMTIKYFHEVGFETLLLHAKVFEKHLPVHIQLDKPHKWANQTGNAQFHGYLIKHNNMNPLYAPMPHITFPDGFNHLERPVKFDEVYDTLYLGKQNRDTGMKWVPVSTEQFSSAGVIGI